MNVIGTAIPFVWGSVASLAVSEVLKHTWFSELSERIKVPQAVVAGIASVSGYGPLTVAAGTGKVASYVARNAVTYLYSGAPGLSISLFRHGNIGVSCANLAANVAYPAYMVLDSMAEANVMRLAKLDVEYMDRALRVAGKAVPLQSRNCLREIGFQAKFVIPIAVMLATLPIVTCCIAGFSAAMITTAGCFIANAFCNMAVSGARRAANDHIALTMSANKDVDFGRLQQAR